MARMVRNSKLDSRTARSRLPMRKSVYWVPISRGFALGYRKGAKGGVWLAKLVRDGGRDEKTLGPADDFLDANGKTILDYAQAQEAARGWIRDLERTRDGEAPSATYTVGDALADYLKDYQRRGGKAYGDAEARVNALIRPELGKLPLVKLSKRRIREWHAALAEKGARLRTRANEEQNFRELDTSDPEKVRQRRATANRTLTILKAALNHALGESKIDFDAAWRHVKPFREVDAAKVRYLSIKECKRLVNATAATFRPMVQAALLSGCRYGELVALRCADFDSGAGTLHVRQSKGGKARHVALPDDGVTLFDQLTAGRAADDRIFTRSDKEPWAKSHQRRPLLAACEAAKISPAVSFHILRHTYASHLVMAGAPLQVVAANLGHSDTRMTEKHYAHLAPSHVANVIRATMPKLGIVKPANVVAVR